MINIFKDKPIYNILKSIRIYMFELYEQISWPFNKCCPSFYRILLGKQLQAWKSKKQKQSSLWRRWGWPSLLFLVTDKTIFLENLTSSYVHRLLVVIVSYYTFHFAYQASHKLHFQYLMEFLMGLQPSSKSSTVK